MQRPRSSTSTSSTSSTGTSSTGTGTGTGTGTSSTAAGRDGSKDGPKRGEQRSGRLREKESVRGGGGGGGGGDLARQRRKRATPHKGIEGRGVALAPPRGRWGMMMMRDRQAGLRNCLGGSWRLAPRVRQGDWVGALAIQAHRSKLAGTTLAAALGGGRRHRELLVAMPELARSLLQPGVQA